MHAAGSGTARNGNQKEAPMNTRHRHGLVDARTELFDVVRGTTACSQMVFYGLLAWVNLPTDNPSNAHTPTKHTSWML